MTSHLFLLSIATVAVVITSTSSMVQKSFGNKRSMSTNSEGNFEYMNEETKQKLSFGVRKIVELDANKKPVCGNRDINFDSKNPRGRNIMRKAKNMTDGNVNFESQLKNNKASNLVKMKGTMMGKGQTNQLSNGNTTVDVECIMKDDNTTTTLEIGNSSTVIKEGDMKCTITIQGYEFCQNCTCPDGSTSQGEYLRVYFKVEAGAGKERLDDPDVSSDVGKIRKEPGSKKEKEILPHFDEKKKSRPVLRCMETQLVDDGTNLMIDSVDITAGQWDEQGGVKVPGVWVDLKRVGWNIDTMYIYDPTASFEDNSLTLTGSSAHLISSIFVLISAVVLEMIF